MIAKSDRRQARGAYLSLHLLCTPIPSLYLYLPIVLKFLLLLSFGYERDLMSARASTPTGMVDCFSQSTIIVFSTNRSPGRTHGELPNLAMDDAFVLKWCSPFHHVTTSLAFCSFLCSAGLFWRDFPWIWLMTEAISSKNLSTSFSVPTYMKVSVIITD